MPIKLKPKTDSSKTDEQKLKERREQDAYIELLNQVKENMYGDGVKDNSSKQTDTNSTENQTDEALNVEEKESKTSLDELLETAKRKGKGKMEMTRVFVDKDLAEIYKLLAMREGVTMSSLMSAVLSEYLKDKVDDVKHRISTKRNKYL